VLRPLLLQALNRGLDAAGNCKDWLHAGHVHHRTYPKTEAPPTWYPWTSVLFSAPYLFLHLINFGPQQQWQQHTTIYPHLTPSLSWRLASFQRSPWDKKHLLQIKLCVIYRISTQEEFVEDRMHTPKTPSDSFTRHDDISFSRIFSSCLICFFFLSWRPDFLDFLMHRLGGQ
jgi:hypothetical protein